MDLFNEGKITDDMSIREIKAVIKASKTIEQKEEVSERSESETKEELDIDKVEDEVKVAEKDNWAWRKYTEEEKDAFNNDESHDHFIMKNAKMAIKCGKTAHIEYEGLTYKIPMKILNKYVVKWVDEDENKEATDTSLS